MITSNCSMPTAPTIQSVAHQRPEDLDGPFFGQLHQPFSSALDFSGLCSRTLRKCSGAKLGMPVNFSASLW